MQIKMKKLTFAVVQAVSASMVLGLAATAVQAQQEPQKVEKIEVTGSNIKRIEGETALPITVIRREDIEKTGITTTAQLLEKLQVNSGATYNLSQGVGDSGQPGFSGASLRGLGPNNTLILIDGRRVANYAFNGAAVDVNSIPLAAVERVEILKDGASAIYGTDAIGGVINFILKSDYQGIEGAYYKTKTDRGGGNTEKYTVTAGFGSLSKQRFNVLVNYDDEKNDPLKAKQRAFAATAIRPDLGIQNTSGNTPPANLRGTYLLNGVLQPFGTIGNPAAATGCNPSIGSFYLPAISGVNCRYDFTSVLDIYPPVTRKSLVARGAFQVTENNQLFAEYLEVKNKTTFASSETPINDFTGINGPIFYPANGRFYPGPYARPNGDIVQPVGPIAIAWRGKDTGQRTDQAESKATRFVVGAKGSIGNWDYEGAFNSAESKVTDTYVNGFLSETRLRAAIATGNVNVFTTAGQDAAGQALLNAAKILEPVRISSGKVDAFDLKASTELWKMAGGSVGLAVGGESRKEKLDDQPQAVLFSGDILGGGGNIPPVAADRRVSALFTEMNFPFTSTLEAGLAIRYDKYSDFGNTTNPKVSLRWTPSKSFLIRGSYNTGFRAPSLPDLFLPRFNSNTADTHNDPLRCAGGTPRGTYVDDGLECNAQFQNQLGGNSALKPEKSNQATIGMLFEPAAGASLGLDAFWIKRRDSLSALGDGTIFDNIAPLDPLNAQGRFVRYNRLANGNCSNDQASNPTPAGVPCAINYVVQVTENLGIFTISGVDVTASLGVPAPVGKFRVSLDGTYVAKYQYQRQKGGDYLTNLGLFTSDNGAITRWRHVLSLDWNFGAWGANVSQNFIAGYKDDGGTRDVGNVETYDGQVSWRGIKNLQLVFGVRNMFDRDPPASGQGQTFQIGYDPRYGDPFGRTYYGKISYAFK